MIPIEESAAVHSAAQDLLRALQALEVSHKAPLEAHAHEGMLMVVDRARLRRLSYAASRLHYSDGGAVLYCVTIPEEG